MNVQEYLRSKTLADLTAELGIKSNRHGTYPNLVLLKYDQIESPNAHPIVVECRGLILDEANNWEVVCRPYDRFFNYGDGNASPIDWNTAKVYEKLDGSLMNVYFYDGKWHVSSSGMPDAAGQVNQDTGLTFASLFWRTWNDLGYAMPLVTKTCYMFELMTPENRVLVPHSERKIVLHGARTIIGQMEEVDPTGVAKVNGWECVKSYPLQSFDDVVKAAGALNPMVNEGFVIVDKDFHRVKVKSPQYVAISHMKGDFTRRRMIELARANEHTEFLTYFPEMAGLYNEIKAKFDVLLADLVAQYEKIKDIPEQKAFAMEATKCKWSAPLFAVRNKKVESIAKYLAGVSAENLEKVL